MNCHLGAAIYREERGVSTDVTCSQQKKGSIVFVTSIAAYTPLEGLGAYSVRCMTLCLFLSHSSQSVPHLMSASDYLQCFSQEVGSLEGRASLLFISFALLSCYLADASSSAPKAVLSIFPIMILFSSTCFRFFLPYHSSTLRI